MSVETWELVESYSILDLIEDIGGNNLVHSRLNNDKVRTPKFMNLEKIIVIYVILIIIALRSNK